MSHLAAFYMKDEIASNYKVVFEGLNHINEGYTDCRKNKKLKCLVMVGRLVCFLLYFFLCATAEGCGDASSRYKDYIKKST